MTQVTVTSGCLFGALALFSPARSAAMPEIDPVLTARARIGNAVKKNDAAAACAARQDLAAARVRRAVLADRGGMRAEQRVALAGLLLRGEQA